MKVKMFLSFVGLLFIILVIYAAKEKLSKPRNHQGETDGIGSDEPVLARLSGTKDDQLTEKDQLICPASPVEAAEGDDVTLDCHLQPEADATNKLIEWKLNENVRVLVFRSKDFSRDDQDEQFRGRAALGSSGKIPQGKIPVTIEKVTKADAGRYSCSVRRGKQRISCSTELTVEPKRQHIRSKASNQSGATLLFVLAISTFLCFLFYRRIMN